MRRVITNRFGEAKYGGKKWERLIQRNESEATGEKEESGTKRQKKLETV